MDSADLYTHLSKAPEQFRSHFRGPVQTRPACRCYPSMHAHTNSLIHESSPYLLQHAHNPVNWYPWGEEALQKAREEDKLVLVSIGYSSCHWCHVMERESFEDEEVARIMNEHYVCIKVDREERPDIDQVYMNAVQLMTGQGGWPLNCFTLPDQRPVYGGTYFRKEDWKSLLRNLDAFFRQKREEAEQYAAKLTAGIRQSEQPKLLQDTRPFTPGDVKDIYLPWKQYFDFREGGHAREPKFPLPNNFLFLLRYAYHFNDADARQIVRLTLDKMSRGGIFDQLGGGFARYSVDAQWHVPHFEKMLYDNGQLVSLYSEAYRYFGGEDPVGGDLYRETVYHTLDFIAREMTSPEGGFYSALDADSEGVEGKFYCWTAAELEKAWAVEPPASTGAGSPPADAKYFPTRGESSSGNEVDPPTGGVESLADDDSAVPDASAPAGGAPAIDEKAVFLYYFDITRGGNWEGTNILRRLHTDAEVAGKFGLTVKELGRIISEGKQRLLSVREKRVRPGLDDKILAAWNGLMLKGCVDAYRAFGAPRFLEIAVSNAVFLTGRMSDGKGGIYRSYKNGRASIPGFLDDYAFTADALIALYEATFDEKWLGEARGLAEYAIRNFYDPGTGMFFYTSSESQALIDRKYEIMDNVLPSSNSVMAHVLYKLGLLYDEPRYRDISVQMLRNVLGSMKSYGSAYSNWAILLQNEVSGVFEVAVTGPEAIEKARELDRWYLPGAIFLGGEKGTLPLLEGKSGSSTRIYVCRNKTCQLPVSDPAEAIALMRQEPAR